MYTAYTQYAPPNGIPTTVTCMAKRGGDTWERAGEDVAKKSGALADAIRLRRSKAPPTKRLGHHTNTSSGRQPPGQDRMPPRKPQTRGESSFHTLPQMLRRKEDKQLLYSQRKKLFSSLGQKRRVLFSPTTPNAQEKSVVQRDGGRRVARDRFRFVRYAHNPDEHAAGVPPRPRRCNKPSTQLHPNSTQLQPNSAKLQPSST